LDFVFAFLAGSSQADLGAGAVSVKEILNGCEIVAASSVVVNEIANKHVAEHRRHLLFPHDHQIHLFWPGVIDICCLEDHAGVGPAEMKELEMVYPLLQVEENAKMRGEGEQC
jgi:hypothetical protein